MDDTASAPEKPEATNTSAHADTTSFRQDEGQKAGLREEVCEVNDIWLGEGHVFWWIPLFYLLQLTEERTTAGGVKLLWPTVYERDCELSLR